MKSGQNHFRYFLWAGFAVILIWQGLFISRSLPLPDNYRDRGTSGLYFDSYRQIFYFYYHLGIFPLSSITAPKVDTREGAQKFVQENGTQLLNEMGHAVRSGERGKVFLYWLDAFLRGGALGSGTRTLHIVAFIAALLALWAAFCWVEAYGFGALSVLFLGSNPFQLAEVYRSSNLFGWPGTVAILLLALSVPLIFKKASQRYGYFYLLLCGCILGVIRTIRPEPLPMVLSIAAVYAYFAMGTWKARFAGVLGLVATVWGVTAGINSYLDFKTREAVALVDESGGYPYPAFKYAFHRYWHPLYIGLGDFDQKYGHVWNDLQAYQLAADILGETSDNYPYTTGSMTMNRYHDAKQYYKIKWEDLPEYNALMGKLFWLRISGDPIWYAEILVRRVIRVLTETTPLSFQLGSFNLSVPWSGWLWLVVLTFAVYRRKKKDVALLLFMVPICATTIAVYSGDGRSFYSIYHLMAAPILLSWLGETQYVRDIRRKFHAWNPA